MYVLIREGFHFAVCGTLPIVAAQSGSKIIGGAGVEVFRVVFALQNINISEVTRFLAGLPSRSSQQTCSMDTVCPASKATARQPSFSTTLRAKAGGEGS